ncbi:MAG: hypothetical protein CL476_09055 [Acidobacteria bacterium]|nr:hypothetical protein [Acidobacteriota bacterium]
MTTGCGACPCWRRKRIRRRKPVAPRSWCTASRGGVNNSHLDADSFGPVVRKGWSALVNAVGADGKLGWVQPVGGAPDSVYETDSHLYGVGAFLLAASEMLQAG